MKNRSIPRFADKKMPCDHIAGNDVDFIPSQNKNKYVGYFYQCPYIWNQQSCVGKLHETWNKVRLNNLWEWDLNKCWDPLGSSPSSDLSDCQSLTQFAPYFYSLLTRYCLLWKHCAWQHSWTTTWCCPIQRYSGPREQKTGSSTLTDEGSRKATPLVSTFKSDTKKHRQIK